MSFFVINRQRFDDSAFAYGEQDEYRTGDFEKCDVCGAPIGMRKWLKPMKVKLSRPTYGDFVFGTFTTFLASEEFLHGYYASGLTGITEYEPVEVVKVNRTRVIHPEIPKYYYVSIKRSKAKIDERLSSFSRDTEEVCEYCRIGGVIKSFKGIFLEEGTWSGEDIFFAIGLPGTIIVSEKFTDFVLVNNFTNISFIPAEQYIAPWALQLRAY